MPARIHLVIGGHLVMSPRGQREASVLQEAGFEVTVSGVAFDSGMSRLDEEIARRQKLRFTPALEMSGHNPASQLRRLLARTRGQLARGRFRRNGTFHPALLGYGTGRLLEICRQAKADLTIVHSEAGLGVAEELLCGGQRVGVDFEDWFSQDLPMEQRGNRPVGELARLEKDLLQRASYRVASSAVMARALAEEYQAPEPAVVTNAVGWDGRAAVARTRTGTASSPLSIHWFSQTIGPARGLELLFDALPHLRHPVRISLRGSCGPSAQRWLGQVLPEKYREQVTLLSPVPPWELPSRVAEHDIGLALETSAIRNRDLCLANKFFHYLQAGLAVIATDTQGQREGMAPCPKAGTVLTKNTGEALAGSINLYAEDREALAAAQGASVAAACGCWNGEAERATIREEAARALRT